VQLPPPSQPANDEIDLGALIHTLWRGKIWIILAIIIATFLGGYQAYVRAPKLYTSLAAVVLEDSQEQIVDIESVMTGLSSDQVAINTEVEVLRSRGLIEKLVLKLNLLEDTEFNRHIRPTGGFSISTVLKLTKDTVFNIFGLEVTKKRDYSEREILDSVIDLTLKTISISNISKSYVFEITVITHNAEKSANIANVLAELYVQDQLDVKISATEQATTWLSERVSELQVELEASETSVKSFLSQTDLIGPEALALLNRQVKDLRERLSKAESHQGELKDFLDTLVTISKSSNPIELAKLLKDQPVIQLAKALKRDGENGRQLFEIELQKISDRKDLEYRRSKSQIASLQASISELQVRITAQSDDLVKLQQLKREAQASKLIYEFFLSRLKETSAQQGILQADSRILSQAVARFSPSSPRKSIIIAIAIVFGALIGGALVLLREFRQNTFRSAEEMETLTGYNVMGQIPMIPAKQRKKVLQYLTEKPTSAAAEAVRNLRTSIVMSNLDNPPKVIMSTSSIPGEGKTTQSLALAQNLSGLGKKVLLMEGDIRRRVFAEYFDIKEKQGLLSILSGETKIEDVAIYNQDLKADILIGEKSAVNAADIFSSDKFHKLLNDLRKVYDFIIIDTPPVLVVPDARVIGQSVDVVIYSVKWDSTSQRQVHQGLKFLDDVGVKVSGLVLAQINNRGMKRYGYGEDYGAYNNYYNN